jgi:hypothetical protein
VAVRRVIGGRRAGPTAEPRGTRSSLAIIEGIDELAKEGRPRVTSEGGKVELHLPDVQEHECAGADAGGTVGERQQAGGVAVPCAVDEKTAGRG